MINSASSTHQDHQRRYQLHNCACEHGAEGGQTCGLIIDQQDANESLTMHLLQLCHLRNSHRVFRRSRLPFRGKLESTQTSACCTAGHIAFEYDARLSRAETAAQASISRGFRPRWAESHRYVEKRRAASSLERLTGLYRQES
jgi:hypothetical protein